jgi:citrate synthase
MSGVFTQGMEDVVAAESAISWIDGRKGELRYRGYPIGELAERCTFEEVAYMLWHGELPDARHADELRQKLAGQRARSTRLLTRIADVPPSAHPLDVLRYVLSWDALVNPLTWRNDAESNLWKSIEMLAWLPVVVAAFHRTVAGLPPVEPAPDLDTAANFLYMLHGEPASEDRVRTLETSLVLHADHELNASTFAARVTIATQSNLHAAIASALGTLSGPRHGGASDRVIHMLEEIGSAANVDAWVRGKLDRHERVMGFGHRVYRTVDPRSRHLRAMAETILARSERAEWIEILRRLGDAMQREKNLYPNVDLYAAVVNRELGVAPAFYTSVFAMSRIAGWTAHVMEQIDGRMIRPVAAYTGPDLRHVNGHAAQA